MKHLLMRLAIVAAASWLTLFAARADAFCGFYVAGADTKLFNDATMVVMMRDGQRTVLAMQNSYEGPPEAFAMVVPVPVVLQEENVKTLPREVFDRVDKLSAPRLVEYWEQDPCAPDDQFKGLGLIGGGSGQGFGSGMGRLGASSTVVVEAEFSVGEYEIVILSASDAAGLDTWLRDNGYVIPSGAEPYFRPYVEAGSKFFVAKVDPQKVKFADGVAVLSPLRFHYDTDEFRLPVRLGLINAKGKQDLIVNILARDRYEVANYPNVTIPTNLDVTDATRDSFGTFYTALFDDTLAKHDKAVVTEYAWAAKTCDPCPDTPLNDGELLTLGADVLPSLGGGEEPKALVAPPKVRFLANNATGPLPKEVVQRILRQNFGRFRLCYQQGASEDAEGEVALSFTITKDGTVTDSVAKADPFPDAKVLPCLRDAQSRLTFPREEGPTKVTQRLRFEPGGGTTAPAMPTGFAKDFVLTRLHARYDAAALGEDLVFKVAGAISGGREVRNDNILEQGSQNAMSNNFQARYAIRHAWTGKIDCEKPVRGRWGDNPAKTDDGAAVGANKPRSATKLGFAKRGGKLGDFLAANAPEKPSPADPAKPAPSASDPAATPADPKSDSACGCRLPGQGGSGPRGWLLALVALGAILVRRRLERLRRPIG